MSKHGPKTSSAPRPVPPLEPPQAPRPGIQHQTQQHPTPENTKGGGFVEWGDRIK